MKKWILVAGVLSISVLGLAVGAEAVASPTPSPAPWYSGILQEIVAPIAGAVAVLIGWFFTWLKGKIAKNDAQRQAIDTLQAAVALVWEDLAKEIKADLADGKIDSDEMARIRALVWNKAMEIAKGPAKDGLILYGKPMVEGFIQMIINKIKGGATSPEPVVIPSPGT